MTSQFKLIIEKIKTDKNIQVAVASIAAATVLVVSLFTYYISRVDEKSHTRSSDQTYRTAASIRSDRYEKIRKDDLDTKIDDKLLESINSTTSSSNSSSRSSDSSTSSARSSVSQSSSSPTRLTRISQNTSSSTDRTASSDSRQDSSRQLVDSIESTESTESTESIESTESSKTKDTNDKVKSTPRIFESRLGEKKLKSSSSIDQTDWNDGQPESKKSEKVSGDSWNDDDVIEEINLDR